MSRGEAFDHIAEWEGTALLVLQEMIRRLEAPQAREGMRLLAAGLRRRARGVPWSAAMMLTERYAMAALSARAEEALPIVSDAPAPEPRRPVAAGRNAPVDC
jgi:hypothetical protein